MIWDEGENKEKCIEFYDQIDAIEGIQRGLDEVANCRTISLSEFEQSLNEVTEND